MPSHRSITGFAAMAIVLGAPLAVGGHASATGTTDPITVTAVADSARAVTGAVARTGGTVSVTGRDGTRYTLTIPDKALEVDTAVTLTPLLRLDGQPFAGGLSAGVSVEPDGLRLYRSATLVITPGKSVSVKNPVPVTYHGTGTSFHLYPMSPTKDLRFGLVHFSGYAIANGSTAEVQAQLQRNAGGAEEALEQRLEPPAAALRTSTTKTASTPTQQLVQILRDDYTNRIRPLLDQAQSDCAAATGAAQQAVAWERRVSIFGLDASFTAESQAVDGAVLHAEQRCWDEARRTCLDANDPGQLPALLAISRIAAVLGLDVTDPTRFDPGAVPPCAWRADIHVSAVRSLTSSDGTSSSTVDVAVAMGGASGTGPVGGTYGLSLNGTTDLSTSASSHQHDEQTGSCSVTTDITNSTTTSGSTPGTTSASLHYGVDGTYQLVFATLPGTSTGTTTNSYVVVDTCVPADSTNQTSTADAQYGVGAIGLSAQGPYDVRSDTISGSGTDTVILPGSSVPAAVTYTWTLSRGPRS